MPDSRHSCCCCSPPACAWHSVLECVECGGAVQGVQLTLAVCKVPSVIMLFCVACVPRHHLHASCRPKHFKNHGPSASDVGEKEDEGGGRGGKMSMVSPPQHQHGAAAAAAAALCTKNWPELELMY